MAREDKSGRKPISLQAWLNVMQQVRTSPSSNDRTVAAIVLRWHTGDWQESAS